jgi:hypothetical protein
MKVDSDVIVHNMQEGGFVGLKNVNGCEVFPI